MAKTGSHHIIAIGASAGGLEEINSFFDHTPVDGVAYVIVQHLSTQFKSRMVELLSKHSKLLVHEAGNGMMVKPNEVYLIPNDKFMTIHENRLILEDKEKFPGIHLTINTFLDSLAVDCGPKAIAIILSGLGSDGREGIRAIKNAGGMVMVRNPETSEYSSMPSSAIATGLVDFILEPESMPGAIEEYIKHQEELVTDGLDDDKNLNEIITLIRDQSPLDFSGYKQNTILRRIKRRAAYKNFTSLEAYHEFIKETPGEIKALSKDFLISVTSFFRDKEAFEFIQQSIFPEILKNHIPGEELKMWVAGCATGEEAYSLAIMMNELLTGDYADVVVKIFATDVDGLAIAHASRGMYHADIKDEMTAERIDKYFHREGDHYQVMPEIRKMVIFAQHDLIKNPPFCNMEFISCRNLLIYMTTALQKKIYLLMHFGLKKGGYLFLGSSENPLSIIENLEVVNKKWKIYRNVETKRVIGFDAFSLPETVTKSGNGNTASSERFEQTNTNLSEAVNNSLVRELDALVICIDEEYNVIRSFGNTTKYLLQKNFNLNILELLPRELVAPFNTLSVQAQKTNEKASGGGIVLHHEDSTIRVLLSVKPLVLNKGVKKMQLITLTEDKTEHPSNGTAKLFNEKMYLDQYTINLEEEVKELKEKLQNAREKLDASNENMQSFNEELLSTNEEMQSTNEEMQSINEELHTINTEYQLKNKELLEINDDLNNYFRSNLNGQLFVDDDLILMRFSPGTVKQINLLPSDVGRPLSNISTNIKFETLAQDIRKVIAEGCIVTKEIETNNGQWYQVMTMPYVKLSGNTRSGAIITFNDITTLKKTQQDLDHKNISLMRINEDLDNFTHTASHDLLAPLANIEISVGLMNKLEVVDPRLDSLLLIINSSVKKFRTLIQDIASIAKIESDMITMEMVDVEEIINNVEWSLDDKIKSTGTIINRNLGISHIYFSKKNLRSIVYNLISNSIKFRSSKAPVIDIYTGEEPGMTVLSVTDNGIGIEQQDISKIFAMYGRLNNYIEGHGIGLYLAKKIIDAANGNITVTSTVGAGSQFIARLKNKP